MDTDLLLKQYQNILTGRWLTDLANTSAFIFQELENLNWVGFYLLENSTLYLGPFQGKPACTQIEVGKGVCGTAVRLNKTIVVPDVHQFEGHIACDSASQSEIVIPLIIKEKIVGVLDIDAPIKARFSKSDEIFLESLTQHLSSHIASSFSQKPC